MVDYAKKTVAELTEILKSRNLSHTGKKAELVARLNDADKEAEETAPAAEEPVAPLAQEAPIDTTAPSTNAPPQPTTATDPAPAPAAPIPAEESPSANTDSALATGVTYALNLPSSEVDAELAKRKARAERFGAVNGDSESKEADEEAQRALDRAKRFGTGAQTSLGKLDEALPLERERGGRKRGRAEGGGGAMEDSGLRKNFRQQGGGGRFHGGGGRNGRDNSRRRQGEKPTGVVKAPPAYTSETDRAAAEARRKKFGS